MIVAAGIILDGTLNYKDETDDKKDREDTTPCNPEAMATQFKLLSRSKLYHYRKVDLTCIDEHPPHGIFVS